MSTPSEETGKLPGETGKLPGETGNLPGEERDRLPQIPDLQLVVLPGAFGIRSPSPFCVKSEMLLAHLGLPYRLTEEPDPRKTPKGKLPYLIADGRKIPDSELITAYLDTLTCGRVYAGLTPRQRAQGMAFTRLAEDHLYWLMVDSRWLDDAWFVHVIDGFFTMVPGFIRPLVANAARKTVRQTLHLQGLGRHTQEERQTFAHQDLQALNAVVADQPYLLGERCSVYDFSVAALLSSIYDNQPATWLTLAAQQYPDLRDYAERVQATTGVYAKV